MRASDAMTIFHITTRQAWAQAQKAGRYEAPSLRTEGFVHCSTLAQVLGTANVLFRGVRDLVLLVIDEGAVASPIRYEPPADQGQADRSERFPHLYGPLPLDAVREVIDFPPRSDGSFVLPDGIDS
jgi:uncharacterized protein (DUF952 family)